MGNIVLFKYIGHYLIIMVQFMYNYVKDTI